MKDVCYASLLLRRRFRDGDAARRCCRHAMLLDIFFV